MMLKTNLLKKLFSLYTLLIVICCIFINIIVYLTGYSQEVSSFTNTVNRIERDISSGLTTVENNNNNLIQQIYTNLPFYEMLYAYCNNSFSDYEKYRLEKYLENNVHSPTSLWYYMDIFFTSTPSISSISVYSPSLNRTTTFKRNKLMDSNFMPDNIEGNKVDYVIESHRLESTLSFPYYKQIPLLSSENRTVFGYIIVEYQITPLEQLVAKSPYPATFILGDKLSNILSSYNFDSSEDLTRLSTTDISYTFPWESISLELKIHFFNKGIYDNLSKTVLLSLLISLFIVSTLLIIFKLILKKMDHLFVKILELIHKSQLGELSHRIHVNEDDTNELTVIATQLNKMNEELDLYIKTVYIAENKQKQAHILALQNQVNPHFLYNTLEVIRMHALKAGNREIGNQISHLSRLHRNLVKGDSHVPLRKELEFCRSYIEIQKIRYGDSFTYNIDCDKQALHYLVPKFILQPIVENYFKYSLDLDVAKNILTIQCSKLEESIRILISNRGGKVTSEDLDNIHKILSTELSNESIGLKNTQERIQLEYGDSYGIQVHLLNPHELIFILILPLDILNNYSEDINKTAPYSK